MKELKKKKIIEYLGSKEYIPLPYNALMTAMDISTDQVEMFDQTIEELIREGEIYKSRKKKYLLTKNLGLVKGKIQGTKKDFAFLLREFHPGEDIYISATKLNGAMHGDKVLIKINESSEGEVVKILSTIAPKIIGYIEVSKTQAILYPYEKKLPCIYIDKNNLKEANEGDIVWVKVFKRATFDKPPQGEVVEVLGHKDVPGIDIDTVMSSYGYVDEFPKGVLEEAESIPTQVKKDLIGNRRDLRKETVITIDGEDARDLDDAISIKKLDNGNYLLGVHIADVSYYVKEDSALDKEAIKRGNSVYFPSRVIPMLPRKLSNGICSLSQGVDRLTFSVDMEINSEGEVVEHEIYESVICSTQRMTYKNVYNILQGDPELIKEYSNIHEMILNMDKLSDIIRDNRRERGSIDFDFSETKVTIDEDGKTIDIKKYEINKANKIIEDFMILCNETVASHFYWLNIPFMYRIHEKPNAAKMTALADFSKKIGFNFKGSVDPRPAEIQALINQVKGTPLEYIISVMALRSLSKAKYSPENSGHFGLASEGYSHFTSPIRRYPDLTIHRIMKYVINGKVNEINFDKLSAKLHVLSEHCSETERFAEEAEREVIDIRKAMYMEDKVGEVFEGIISGVIPSGFFVQIDNTVEGFVSVVSLNGYYIYNREEMSFIGERSKIVYKLGDKIKVKLNAVSVGRREINFKVIEKETQKNNYKKQYNKKGRKRR